jgi:hypothetical protein
MVLGVVPTVTADTLMAFQAVDYAGGKMTNLRAPGDADAPFDIKIGGTSVTPSSIDYKNGLFYVTVKAADAGKNVTGTYKALHFGTSSYLDFKGVAGAFNILLKK